MNVGLVGANGSVFNYEPLAGAKGDFGRIYAENISGLYTPLAEEIGNSVNPDNFYGEIEKMAVASAEKAAEEKEKFADMYVTSAAHRYFSENRTSSSLELLNLRAEIAGIAHKENCMLIPIEAGELPQFMEEVQVSLEQGKSLADIFKQKYDEHISKYGKEGHTNSFADWFAINTSTGEVMSADPVSRTYSGDSFGEELADVEAVMELADDLKTFLKYAAFSEDMKNSEKVHELISFIKNKQAYANYDRFLGGDSGKDAAGGILEALISAGVLKYDEESEKKEAVDGLMEAIRVHEEELREKRIDSEESKRAVREIWEIVSGEMKPFKFF